MVFRPYISEYKNKQGGYMCQKINISVEGTYYEKKDAPSRARYRFISANAIQQQLAKEKIDVDKVDNVIFFYGEEGTDLPDVFIDGMSLYYHRVAGTLEQYGVLIEGIEPQYGGFSVTSGTITVPKKSFNLISLDFWSTTKAKVSFAVEIDKKKTGVIASFNMKKLDMPKETVKASVTKNQAYVIKDGVLNITKCFAFKSIDRYAVSANGAFVSKMVFGRHYPEYSVQKNNNTWEKLRSSDINISYTNYSPRIHASTDEKVVFDMSNLFLKDSKKTHFIENGIENTMVCWASDKQAYKMKFKLYKDSVKITESLKIFSE